MAYLVWQSAKGGVRVNYTESVNTTGNSSQITVTSVQIASFSHYGYPFYADGVITINGTPVLTMNGLNTYSVRVDALYTLYTLSNSSGSTVTVNHNSDGSGTASIGIGPRTGFHDFNLFCIGANNGSIAISPSSQQITLTNIPRKSSISTSSTGTLGSALSIAINSASSSFKHTLKYSFGTKSDTIASNVTSSTVSWKPELGLATEIPNATSGKCTITCESYSGSTPIGTSTATVTLSVPADIKPTISNIAISPINENQTVAGWGVYIQNFSKLKVVTTASRQYGATISSYSVTLNGVNIGNASTVISPQISESGTLTVKVTVKDSRGRTDSSTKDITVYEYSKPAIDNVAVFRCDQDGKANVKGTYISICATKSYSSINGKNNCTMQYRYKPANEGSYGSAYTYASGDKVIIGNGNIDISQSYYVQILAGDALNPLSSSPTISQTVVPSQTFTLHCKNGGLGVAVGKSSEIDNCFEVAETWEFRVGNGKLKIGGNDLLSLIYPIGAIYISTASANPSTYFGGTWERIEGRFLVGCDSTYKAGNTGGAAAHTHTTSGHALTSAEMPRHNHEGFRAHDTSLEQRYTTIGSVVIGGTDAGAFTTGNGQTMSTKFTGGSGTAQSAATGQSHSHGDTGETSNLPPYLAVYMWKRTA